MGSRKVWEALPDLLYPRRCPFCRQLLERDEPILCRDCEDTLPWIDRGQRPRGGEFFTGCVAPLWYEEAARQSHHRFKFRGLRSYAAPYAALMARCVEERLTEPFDVVTWVPLSRKRLAGRGYDQAKLLAVRLAPLLGKPCRPLLKKIMDTPAQSGLKSLSERRSNVLGAFAVHRDARVEGLRVLLVDDVMTTGATLSECARMLRTAGAERVCCAVLAHTPLDGR